MVGFDEHVNQRFCGFWLAVDFEISLLMSVSRSAFQRVRKGFNKFRQRSLVNPFTAGIGVGIVMAFADFVNFGFHFESPKKCEKSKGLQNVYRLPFMVIIVGFPKNATAFL